MDICQYLLICSLTVPVIIESAKHGTELDPRVEKVMKTLAKIKQDGKLDDIFSKIPRKGTQEYLEFEKRVQALSETVRQRRNVKRGRENSGTSGMGATTDTEPIHQSKENAPRMHTDESDEGQDGPGKTENFGCPALYYKAVCLGRPQSLFGNLHRIEPNKVGDVMEMDIDGRTLKRYTRALQPPLYEIPDFLTAEECEVIIECAERNGLEASGVMIHKYNATKEMTEKDLRNITRISNTTFLEYDSNETLRNIRDRVKRLTDLPQHIMLGSEPLQVVRYDPGGHYHGHFDSDTSRKNDYKIPVKARPCCHLSRHCTNKATISTCCRVCRFATVLFYLNDVEEGGETAFPWALVDEDEPLRSFEEEDSNLSYNCHSANIVMKPRRGTAILWYSHLLDKEGWMGDIDPASFHGGCDVMKGVKWIANSWIAAPEYQERDIKSVWSDL